MIKSLLILTILPLFLLISFAETNDSKNFVPLHVWIEDGDIISESKKTITIMIVGVMEEIIIEILIDDTIIDTLSFPKSINGEINQSWIIDKKIEPKIYTIRVIDSTGPYTKITFEYTDGLITNSSAFTLVLDKQKYIQEDIVLISGTTTDIDLINGTANYYLYHQDETLLESGNSNLDENGIFNILVNIDNTIWNKAGDIIIVVNIQNHTESSLFYYTNEPDMSNESLYERSMIHEEKITSNNSTLLSHNTILNDHDTRLINMIHYYEEKLTDMKYYYEEKLNSVEIEINSIRQEMQGIKDQIGGSPPQEAIHPEITNFVGTTFSNGTLAMSWDITGQPILTYDLIYRYDIGAWTTDYTIPINATTHTIHDLENTQYELKLTAQNEHGNSKIAKLTITP